MPSSWDAIMAIDPGGTTGVSSGAFPRRGSMKSRLRRGRRMRHEQIPMAACTPNVPNAYSPEMAAAFVLVCVWNEFCERVKPLKPVLVVEDFYLRRQAGSQKREGLSPVRIASSLEGLLYMNAPGGLEWTMQPVYQMAAHAKGYATDARLREWGLWHVGEEHARDASRHLATRLAKLK